jgi:P4 family phage/plasmid primase-like protien
MMMQMAGVAFDADARAAAWVDRLAVMHADPVAREALRRIYGMTLTGLISDQAFYIFQGRGQDGKSTSNDVIGALHGDYFRRASPKSFLQGPSRGGAEHQSDIVRLAGDIRLVVIDEPQARSTWDGERIKQATGSAFTARGVGAKTEKTFTPRWNLIAECNELPRAPSDDRGFRRRFKLLPWTVQFGVTPGVPDDPIHEVKARLMAERSGILNWMIGGALAWLEEGKIPEPEMSLRANASFWSVSSAMGEFVESCCDVSDPAAQTGATELYTAFRDFCVARGDKEDAIMKQTGFGLKLNTLQIYAGKDARGNKVRVGIRLKSDAAAAGAGVNDPVPGWDAPGGVFDG